MSARWGHPDGDFAEEELGLDRDAPQEADLGDEQDDETPTEPCPNCGRDVADLAERCPYCGEWITGGGAASSRRTLAVIVVIAALIVALLIWLL